MILRRDFVGRSKVYPLVEIQGVKVRIPYPDEIPRGEYVKRGDLLERALAAWTKLDGLPPLNFRLYGPPGVGKNALVYECARLLGKPLYSMVGHAELNAEDVACSARLTSGDIIEYVASPLFAAMLKGGIFFLDEIAKAPPAALNPLAAVLDERRTLTSVLAGIHITAHPEFLFCAALNEDEELGGQLPQFIQERLIPAIHVGIPARDELKRILRSHLAMVNNTWVDIYLSDFWREGEISPRDAKKHLQFAYGLATAAGWPTPSDTQVREFLTKANGKGNHSESSRAPEAAPTEAEEPLAPEEKADDGKPLLAFPSRRKSKAIH